MLCCLTVKEVEQCCITGWIHQQRDQRDQKSPRFEHRRRNWNEQQSDVFRLCVFPAGFVKRYYAAVCFPHVCRRRRRGAEWIVKMTNRALCFCLFLTENVIVVRESDEAFVEMGVEQRGNVQPTLCSSSITITRLIPNIAWYCLSIELGTLRWNLFYVRGSFLFCSRDCVGQVFFFYHGCCWKAGCLKKEEQQRKAYRKHGCNNIASTLEVKNSGVCIIECNTKREAGYVWTWYW